MEDLETLRRLGMALAIGLLLGLERGWHERGGPEGRRTAGIRTFALAGLLGGVSGWLADVAAPILPAAAFLALAALLAVSYVARLRRDDDLGLTTEIALLLTFCLGVAAVRGEMAPAAAVAVVATLLLAMKDRLHGWVFRTKRIELDALLKLALISVVILPVLPDRGYGPGEALNPYELWWAVVIVAGLSFFGYVAVRIGGAYLGILLTGLCGGLASSTSTTLALARRVRARPDLAALAAAGVVIAGSVTFLRILMLVAIFRPALLPRLGPPMVAMAAVGLVGALIAHFATAGRREIGGAVEGIADPLELKAALSFGAVLAIVALGVHHLENALGAVGVYAGAALAGVTDVDALTISVSRLVERDLSVDSGAVAIFIAASVNTAVKAGIGFVAGSARLGAIVAPIYAAAIAVGAAALWFGAPAVG